MRKWECTMKTKIWAIILVILLVVCGVGGYFLLNSGASATRAEIVSNGEVVKTVDLCVDQSFTVTAEDGGYNVITVKNGAIAVTEASCPDHYCQQRGYCTGGAQIVCLPNKLVIRFVESQEVDAVLN